MLLNLHPNHLLRRSTATLAPGGSCVAARYTAVHYPTVSVVWDNRLKRAEKTNCTRLEATQRARTLNGLEEKA